MALKVMVRKAQRARHKIATMMINAAISLPHGWRRLPRLQILYKHGVRSKPRHSRRKCVCRKFVRVGHFLEQEFYRRNSHSSRLYIFRRKFEGVIYKLLLYQLSYTPIIGAPGLEPGTRRPYAWIRRNTLCSRLTNYISWLMKYSVINGVMIGTFSFGTSLYTVV